MDNKDQFEENLRQILSHGPVSETNEQGESAEPAQSAERTVIKPTRRYEKAVDRYEKEQKALFWFKLLRPIAVAALLGLLAMFVMRITNYGS